jgi:uncharacterized membrane protein SpoIIM required for sporulation
MRTIDAFIAANQDRWARLDELVARAARAPRTLTPAELDELLALHLAVSSHLSTARTHLGDPDLVAALSRRVTRSAAVVHGTRARTWQGVRHSLTRTFPAAVWHLRVAVAVSTLTFIASAAVMAIWLALSPAAVEASAPETVRQAYLEEDFEAYYSSEPGTAFAARVFTNNAAVGALAFGTGIAWGVPTLGVLVLNGVNVGLAAGLFHAAGDAVTFWTLILPHGLLELTAIFIAGGAGLRLGWAALAPGDRTRTTAVAEEGRRSVVVVLGLVVVFLVAGLLEGYVTAAPWPTWARVGTGAVVWAGFLGWVVAAGRRAAADGLTGAIGEQAAPRGAVGPVTSPRGS